MRPDLQHILFFQPVRGGLDRSGSSVKESFWKTLPSAYHPIAPEERRSGSTSGGEADGDDESGAHS
jgi:hypothetical protein